MIVHVVVIRRTQAGKETVEVSSIHDVSTQFSDDLANKIQLCGFSPDLQNVCYTTCNQALLTHYTYAEYISASNGDDTYVGFSTMSLFSAVGAAYTKLVTEDDIEVIHRR